MLPLISFLRFFEELGNQVSWVLFLNLCATNSCSSYYCHLYKLGEDGDACYELLIHALESLRGLPPASIFHLLHQKDNSTFDLWFGLVDKSTSFLRSIVFEYVLLRFHYLFLDLIIKSNYFIISRESSCSIPLRDRQVALQLLLELSIQRGSLQCVLLTVHLLLELWDVEESGQVLKHFVTRYWNCFVITLHTRNHTHSRNHIVLFCFLQG